MNNFMKMKDLEAQTGVSREAIHFYLREGLLPEPDRPKRNVAYYSDEHVMRIKAIKQLQQDKALPLGEIKKLLAKFDYNSYAAGDDLAKFEIVMRMQLNGEVPADDEEINEVADRLDMRVADIRAMGELGVIEITEEGDKSTIDFRDVAIIERLARLNELGMGFDADHVARFASFITKVAKLEVDDFLREFGNIPAGEASITAAEGIGLTNEIIARLRTQALIRTLKDVSTKDK